MDASLENKNERLLWLDFAKAAGILVVLAVHAGLQLGSLTFYGGMFYMPVFFVAAGYTCRCRVGESYSVFLKKKAKRLLFPYAGTSLFLWAFFWVKDSLLRGNPADLKLWSLLGILYSRNQMYAPGYAGENPVLLNILNSPLWFLTALFLVYVYYEALNRSGGRKYPLLAAGLLFSVVWHYTTALLLPWSLEAVPYFACFFVFGEELRKRDGVSLFLKKWPWTTMLLAGFLVLARINGSVNLSCGVYGRSMLLYLLIGSAGSLLVFLAGAALERICRPLVRTAAWVGRQTLWILCLHMFAYMVIGAALRILVR